MSQSSEAENRLVESFRKARGELILVVTGAGISAASGIPTFRGDEPDAIWKKDDVELATYQYFLRDPVNQWKWYLARFGRLSEARPNPAHRALILLERWQGGRGGEMLLVTQNIDTLHEEAGSRNLIKVHGTSSRVRCSRKGCALGAPRGSLPRQSVDFQSFRQNPGLESLPRCPECGSLLRAHVLFFDEYYTDHEDYGFDNVQAALARMALVLFIGTSLSVGITDLILHTAGQRHLPVFLMEPWLSPSCPVPVLQLRVKAEEALPSLCRSLKVESAT